MVQRTAVGRLVLLALVLATACGAELIGTAAAGAGSAPAQAGAPVRLELTPAAVDIEVGRPARYTAATVDANGHRTDVTQETTLRFEPIGFQPAGRCSQRKLPGFIEASCPDPGRYKVTGQLDVPPLSSDPPARLRVITRRIRPRISSVVPNPSPPNRTVEVQGTTGSCNQEGTLTLKETDAAPVPVVGRFTATLEIPAGIAPKTYTLLLEVDCHGKQQKDRFKLTVEKNQPPHAANDREVIDPTPGTASTIEVLGNDTDPDDPDGYETRVTVEHNPAHGTAVERGQAIDYTPGKGFLDAGKDQFTYRYCDVIDAGGALDCGDATVTVVKRAPEPVDAGGVITVQGQPVAIQVMRNDRNAGKSDIDRLRVLTDPAPKGGSAERRSDGTIKYSPRPEFTGTDTFRYDYCGDPIVVTVDEPCRPPATVTVTVEPLPVDPRIDSVEPNPSPPNREVTVKGTTGSCDKAARLTLDSAPEAALPVPVSGGQGGGFEAKLKVPPGTFVGPYRLELHVTCEGKSQVVEHKLTVANQPPKAADDPAGTTMDTPVTIDVIGNDVDPDGDDGYRISVDPGRPKHGTAVVQQPGNGVRYRPDKGFTGEDRFGYRFCDVVDARGTPDCGAATVIVTVSNQAPEAVDDPARTVRDRSVRIEVTGNDKHPDPAKLHVSRPPALPATAVEQRQPPGSILYTPAMGFTGTDTFRYDYCGGPVRAAAAGRACPFATVTVTVTATPAISSVRPGSSPAGRTVEVAGSTGFCKRAGTLSLQGTSAAVGVSGDRDGGFTASLTVPPGTFPGEYRLELRVDCKGQVQRAEATLTVSNQAPEAVDDPAITTPNTPVTIDVVGNDRDPDDPDGYPTRMLVTSRPAHGTAEEQPDQTIVYTPASGFVGQDRFGYSLCDDVLNAAGRADCGAATVTVTVSGTACVPTGVPSRLEVAPGRGPGGTRLHITAAVDRRLAACPVRFFLGGTPLGPDVRVGGDGSISADRGVPGNARRGPSTVRLATQNAMTLAERSFEVVGGPIPWPVRLALGVGALLVGALARIAFRRWRTSREQRSGRRPAELPDVRAEPHTRTVEVGVEPVPDGTQTFAVQLQPHADPGTQTLQEVAR